MFVGNLKSILILSFLKSNENNLNLRAQKQKKLL